jgi:hypothetical protein
VNRSSFARGSLDRKWCLQSIWQPWFPLNEEFGDELWIFHFFQVNLQKLQLRGRQKQQVMHSATRPSFLIEVNYFVLIDVFKFELTTAATLCGVWCRFRLEMKLTFRSVTLTVSCYDFHILQPLFELFWLTDHFPYWINGGWTWGVPWLVQKIPLMLRRPLTRTEDPINVSTE